MKNIIYYLYDSRQAIITIFVLTIAYFQFREAKRQKRAEFTYKIYSDLIQWLNAHYDFKKCLITGEKEKELDQVLIGDFLEYFEAVYIFEKKKLLDKKIATNLFIYWIDKAQNEVIANFIKEDRKT